MEDVNAIFAYITNTISGGIRTDLLTVIFGCLSLALIYLGWRLLIRVLTGREDNQYSEDGFSWDGTNEDLSDSGIWDLHEEYWEDLTSDAKADYENRNQ